MNHDEKMSQEKDFKFFVEQFADIKIGRFDLPKFDTLPLKQKKMIYYLSQAALSGWDIIWDQNYKHNLKIRRTLEAIAEHYKGSRKTGDFRDFMIYTKMVWFSKGVHHHSSKAKILPGFSEAYFAELVKHTPGSKFPVEEGETLNDLISELTPLLFNPGIDAVKVSTNTHGDLVLDSANNFYENVTQSEVEHFYKERVEKNDTHPMPYGLNSKFVKENGKLTEKPWKVCGMYSSAIERIIYWLRMAANTAENDIQRKSLDLSIRFYQTGDLKVFDEYCITWLQDTDSHVDFTNGFIETYDDPLNYRASYESLVSFRDEEASGRVLPICENAQWFEDNSPIAEEHKNKDTKVSTAGVITLVSPGGAIAVTPPVGINLPNSEWIKKVHGSKSMTFGNISRAYKKVSEGFGLLEEFSFSEKEIDMDKQYGEAADNLHTNLHEIIGHNSGQMNPGVGIAKETLGNYAAVIEEAKADLVAYYFIVDPKLIDIGVMPSLDVGKTSYNHALRNGLLQQLARIKPGGNIEHVHMRGRYLVARRAFELGNPGTVIEKKMKNGKTYFVINDYRELRTIFGKMLREIQGIISEGDHDKAKYLVEAYGVKVDPELHKEVLLRYKKLGIAPCTGLISPMLVPVLKDNEIIDVKVEYPEDFTGQMLSLAKNFSFLPTYN